MYSWNFFESVNTNCYLSAFYRWYVTLNPHFCVYICVSASDLNDFDLDHNVSVANLLTIILTLNVLSYLYCHSIESISERITFFIVANIADLARFGQNKTSVILYQRSTWYIFMYMHKSSLPVDLPFSHIGLYSIVWTYLIMSSSVHWCWTVWVEWNRAMLLLTLPLLITFFSIILMSHLYLQLLLISISVVHMFDELFIKPAYHCSISC